MKRITLFILPVACFLSHCAPKVDQENATSGKEYKTDFFRINIPINWVATKGKSIDANSLIYFVSGRDTIIQEISCYANNLSEPEPIIKPKSVENLIDSAIKIENKIIFVADKKLEKGIDIDKFRKQNVNYNNVDGFEVKVIMPRQEGIGATGFYCDSIGNDHSIGRIRVNMYGENLTPKTQKELLTAISTLKFQKK